MKKNIEFNYQNIFLVIILGTYIFASSLSNLFGNIKVSFTILQRLIVFFLSIFIIIINYRNFSIKKMYIFYFIAFWLYYLIKMYYSFQNDNYFSDFRIFFNEYYIRVIVNCLIPIVAILLLDFQRINYSLIIQWIYSILFIMLTINLLFGFNVNRFGTSNGIFNVYYISYGHFGTSLAVLSSYFLLFRKNIIQDQILFLLGFFLGILTIINSSARSPLLSFIVISIYLAILYKKKKLLLTIILGIFIFIIVIFYLYHSGFIFESSFVNRTYSTIFEGNNSNRIPLFKSALEIFSQNPILGGRVFFEDGMYAHNFFLELLMSTGLFGSFLCVLYYLPLIKNITYFLNYNLQKLYILPFFILFLQYFILSLTSYSLIGNLEFCYYGALIISIAYLENNINNNLSIKNYKE